MDLYDCSGLLIKISQNQFTRKSEKLYDHLNYTLTDDQELINIIVLPITVAQSWFLAGVCLTWPGTEVRLALCPVKKVAIGYKAL